MYKHARANVSPCAPALQYSLYDAPSEQLLGYYARFQEPLRVRKPRTAPSAPRKFSWEA